MCSEGVGEESPIHKVLPPERGEARPVGKDLYTLKIAASISSKVHPLTLGEVRPVGEKTYMLWVMVKTIQVHLPQERHSSSHHLCNSRATQLPNIHLKATLNQPVVQEHTLSAHSHSKSHTICSVAIQSCSLHSPGEESPLVKNTCSGHEIRNTSLFRCL